jgi:hypothetical protein
VKRKKMKNENVDGKGNDDFTRLETRTKEIIYMMRIEREE